MGCGASTPAPPPRPPPLLLWGRERPARVGRLLFLFRSCGFQILVQSHAEAPLAQLSVTPITPAPHPAPDPPRGRTDDSVGCGGRIRIYYDILDTNEAAQTWGELTTWRGICASRPG